MSAWTPQETGVHQICYLLAEVQKPGTNQGQVRLPTHARRAALSAPCLPCQRRAGRCAFSCRPGPGGARRPVCPCSAPLPAAYAPALWLREPARQHSSSGRRRARVAWPARLMAHPRAARRSSASSSSARSSRTSTTTWRSSSRRATACLWRRAGARGGSMPAAWLLHVAELLECVLLSCACLRWEPAAVIRSAGAAGAQVRQSAGLLLKNNVKENYATTTDEYRRYIKVRSRHRLRQARAPPAVVGAGQVCVRPGGC